LDWAIMEISIPNTVFLQCPYFRTHSAPNASHWINDQQS